MRAFVPLLLLGCGPGAGVLIDEDGTPILTTDEPVDTAIGTGWTDDPWAWTQTEPEIDASLYEGAYARIVEPLSGAVVPWGELQTYTVEVRTPDGRVITPTAVQWLSSADVDFYGDEASFETDSLELGVHTLTVLADLPTGARLAHSIADVRVQHPSAGTYAGLFSVDGTVQGITITCTGAALLEIGAQGVLADGDGDCLVSLLGVDIPMVWLFALENQAGVIGGVAGVDLFGLFTYDIPVTGGSLSDDGRLEVDFAGPIPFVGELAAFLDVQRI